jgi:hypothetical protein
MPLILSAKVQEQVIVRDRATGRVLLKVFPAEIRGEKVRLAFSADKDAIEINRLPVPEGGLGIARARRDAGTPGWHRAGTNPAAGGGPRRPCRRRRGHPPWGPTRTEGGVAHANRSRRRANKSRRAAAELRATTVIIAVPATREGKRVTANVRVMDTPELQRERAAQRQAAYLRRYPSAPEYPRHEQGSVR